MNLRRVAFPAVLATLLAVLPSADARAQCFTPLPPLLWPVAVAGNVLCAAAAVVTAPLQALAAPAYFGPYYYVPPAAAYYPPPPAPYPPPYPPAYSSPPGYYGYPWR